MLHSVFIHFKLVFSFANNSRGLWFLVQCEPSLQCWICRSNYPVQLICLTLVLHWTSCQWMTLLNSFNLSGWLCDCVLSHIDQHHALQTEVSPVQLSSHGFAALCSAVAPIDCVNWCTALVEVFLQLSIISFQRSCLADRVQRSAEHLHFACHQCSHHMCCHSVNFPIDASTEVPVACAHRLACSLLRSLVQTSIVHCSSVLHPINTQPLLRLITLCDHADRWSLSLQHRLKQNSHDWCFY